MGYLKNSPFYYEAIQEVRYPFATFYLFDTFIVGEVDEGMLFTWDDHAKEVVKEMWDLYDKKGKRMVYITNRVHSYSVKPGDWIKFFKSDYKLKGYAIVTYNRKGFIASMVEKLFFRNNFKTFDNLENAIMWAKELSSEEDGSSKDKIA